MSTIVYNIYYMPNTPKLKFPKNFLWGVATSAHQVEGGLHNQWTVWELENAKALAAQAPYQYEDLENWDDIKQQAKSPDNYVSGAAVGHYQLYEQDIDLVRRMNMNAMRLSIEWSRVQPTADGWDVKEVEHYKAVLAACKKRGIEPIVTLFHFTLPVWFASQGGFEKTGNVRYFVEFAERILAELGANVKYVITINEPDTYVRQSYLEGRWPPQKINRRTAYTVRNNLARAHNRVADKLHATSRRYKVSIAKNYSYIYAGDDSRLSVRASQVMQYRNNDSFLRKVIKRCDFIGVDYYTSERVYGYRVHNPETRVSDIGWDMQPHHLATVLEDLYESYAKPIMITGNGLADGNDAHRKWWLTQTIVSIQMARDKGVEVWGYLHWSLTDNFDWDKGFWSRYGLFAVDYKTMKRTPRASAVWLAGLLKKIRE